jgi:hypothetical protein
MKEFVALNKLRKMLFRKVFLTAFDEYKEEVREKLPKKKIKKPNLKFKR